MDYRILITDDDLDNRTIASDSLRGLPVHIVLATNGIEALEIAQREKPDLILLDLSMPEQDGWKTAQKLKSAPETRAAIIIAYTAHAMEGDKERALECGCDDYLSKPAPPRKIRETVERWLKSISDQRA